MWKRQSLLVSQRGLTMNDYLTKKYLAYNNIEKLFTPDMVQHELLCGNTLGRLHVKQVLGSAKSKFTKDEFFKVICVTLDLDN